MITARCRFHVVGSEPSFQTVVAVTTDLLGKGATVLLHRGWPECRVAGVRPDDTVVGHIGSAADVELVLEFARRFSQSGLRLPRILVVADALDMAHEVGLLKAGVSECLIRPLNLQRFGYLLQSIVLKARARAARTSGGSAPFRTELATRIAKLAAAQANVLITGETGVGKSFHAAEMHAASARAKRPFVVVNCAAIPEHLFESELFGHEKGAFTGADRRHVGKLEFAGKGTVLLDDVDSIPLAVQPKLLHAVENREFYPVGSNRIVKLQARLISATNRDLLELTEQGSFRADLMYRLNTCELPIPSLRERLDEMTELLTQFAEEFAEENQQAVPQIDDDALLALRHYAWPGNIRELRNAIQFGAIDSDDGVIHRFNLPERVRDGASEAPSTDTSPPLVAAQLGVSPPFFDDARRLIAALVRHDFNRTEAAASLGYSRTTLYHKLGRLHIC